MRQSGRSQQHERLDTQAGTCCGLAGLCARLYSCCCEPTTQPTVPCRDHDLVLFAKTTLLLRVVRSTLCSLLLQCHTHSPSQTHTLQPR